MTIVQIEIMDLSLSVDNVIAAVALAPKGPDGEEKMWVVYTGVAIGILALRLAAGVCIRLLHKYPVLAQTAFLLVGYVGFILVFELLTHIHILPWQKFIGIVIITAITLYYGRSHVLQAIIKPVIRIALPLMRAFAGLLDWVFWPLRKLHELIARMFRKALPKEETQT
jgi:tellurite resistance protein TerC